MKEWILNNTTVTESEYDNLINGDTINNLEDNLGIREKSIDVKSLTPRKLGEHPLLVIDEFTVKKANLLRKYLYYIKGKKGKYSYNGIDFFVLADMLKNMSDVLYSYDRKGKCAELSSIICMEYFDTNIVTAMCVDPYYKEDFYFLHTFLVFQKNCKEYVIDATWNMIMEKNLYLELFKGKIISNISREEYYNILINIRDLGLGNDISLIEYLCFPKEVTDGIKKLSRKLAD